MSKTEQTSMEDLLSRRIVDEKEKSPDDQPDGQMTDDDVPEAFEGKEPFSEASQQDKQKQPTKAKEEPKAEAKPKGEDEGEDSEKRRMSGLPKWAHLRMEANNAKAEAAQREAAELRRQLEALKSGNGAQQGNGDGEEGSEETWDQWTKKQIEAVEKTFDERDWVRRNQFGWRLALIQHGEEATHQATGWAKDMMESNRAFAAAIRQADDPVEFAINEFRSAQVKSELQQYGGNLEALIKARVEAALKHQPAAGEQTGAASQPQTTQQTNQQQQPRMPNDFAGSNSGAGRVNSSGNGVTPLSELLSLNSGKRRA